MALSTGRPVWVLPSTLPCGVRTFLERCRPRSPGRLLRTQSREPRPAVSSAPRCVLVPPSRGCRCSRSPRAPSNPSARRRRSRPRSSRPARPSRPPPRARPSSEFIDAYRESPDRGVEALKQIVVGPDLRSWVRWLDVQHREFEGTIRSAADIRDVEFIGTVTARRIPLASVGSVRIGPVPVRAAGRRPDRPRPGPRRPRHADPDGRRDVPRRGPAAQRRTDVRQHPAVPPPGAHGGWRDRRTWIRCSCSRPSGSST